MVVQFLVLSFGFMFTHRMIEFQMSRKPLPEAISKKIIRTQILFFWVLTILSPWIPVVFLFFFAVVPNLAATRLDWILNFILRQKFKQNLLSFVDELILLMMTGKSFRDSFLQITANSNDFFHAKLREVLVVSQNPRHSSTLKQRDLLIVVELVQSIDQTPHKALDKLRSFQRQLRWGLSFKKKTQQATIQIRAQAGILSILYLLLLAFTVLNQEESTFNVILPSSILFIVGLILIFFLGRRQKWKT